MSTTLLVASPGGHLDELWTLRPQLVDDGSDVVWITARTSQSESLLRDCRVVWTRRISSRELGKAIGTLAFADAQLRSLRPTRLISTGAALAIPFVSCAWARNIPVHFIDSATRLDDPSLSARIASWLPGVHMYTQTAGLARHDWQFIGNVFDTFRVAPTPSPRPVERVVVSLGTERFPFDRAVAAVERVTPPDAEIVWQLGSTSRRPSRGDVTQWMTFDELGAAMRDADVVITHAGVGSVLSALGAGRCPVVFPRSDRFGEHIDDHQRELARGLSGNGHAIVADPEVVTTDMLNRAASLVTYRDSARRVPLRGL